MEKNFDNAIELFTVTEEELEKINKYSLTELTEKDIFAFNVILCDNEIDRDFECFDTSALNKLAELFVGGGGRKIPQSLPFFLLEHTQYHQPAKPEEIRVCFFLWLRTANISSCSLHKT